MENTSARKAYVNLDHDLCVSCNQCISVCPVRLPNRESKSESGKYLIDIRSEYCIDCGRCVKYCGKRARIYRDDTERFFKDLADGKSFSIIFAPAFKNNYPEYRRILGYLKSFNINKIYDTSFGAEITTWAYLNFIIKSKERGWISQPCPVVVNMIEKYYPELIPKLIPIHSPMMCTAIYMRTYMHNHDDLVFISPCIGKKDEIERYGNIKYNVTFKKLVAYLKDNNISYLGYEEVEPDSPPAELGNFYPVPGGLRANVEFHTGNNEWIRQIEGGMDVYNYFKQYKDRVKTSKPLPLLVDVLNCKRGCNDGTATDKTIKSDDVELANFEEHKRVHAKYATMKARSKYKPFENFNKVLRLNDFMTEYVSQNLDVAPPPLTEIDEAFRKMNKYTMEEKNINCKSCGYNTCTDMAEMIARGINVEVNCVHYNKKLVEKDAKELELMYQKNEKTNTALTSGVKTIVQSVEAVKNASKNQVTELTVVQDNFDDFIRGTNSLNKMIVEMKNDMNNYLTLTHDIVNVADQTNLLSFNASVEAARAGAHGKEFAVVAEEVRALSLKVKKSANESTEINESVQPLLQKMLKISDQFIQIVDNLNASIGSISTEVSSTSDHTQKINEIVAQMLDEIR